MSGEGTIAWLGLTIVGDRENGYFSLDGNGGVPLQLTEGDPNEHGFEEFLELFVSFLPRREIGSVQAKGVGLVVQVFDCDPFLGVDCCDEAGAIRVEVEDFGSQQMLVFVSFPAHARSFLRVPAGIRTTRRSGE